MARLRLPPKNAYPHEISYKQLIGEDDWGKPEYSELTILNNVRVDESYDFKRSGVNTNDDMPNALISMFNKYNSNMPKFKNEGIITFNDQELIILSVIPLYFMSDEVIGYELEVK